MQRKPRAFDEKVVWLDLKSQASPQPPSAPPFAGAQPGAQPGSAAAHPPRAGGPPPQAGPPPGGVGRSINKFGCRCARSKCIKKYCECFAAGVKCSVYCQCVNCMNAP